MEATSFELTPKQKGILDALSRKTGKSISTLIDEALELLLKKLAYHRDGTGW